MTSTPTATPTAVLGCGNITVGQIKVAGPNVSMTITNPHEAITVQNVQITWNHDAGAGGATKPQPLSLQYVVLGSQSWAVVTDQAGPSATITPSPTMIIPGNNITSTITFIFSKAYQNLDGTESIKITLSTPGCENYIIQRPLPSQ